MILKIVTNILVPEVKTKEFILNISGDSTDDFA